ncbi:MAG: DMT family transporter [Acidobacteria bacterium]|nr:DMT family transporter [Acidobacteriota bacterium]MDW7984948.1 DMT family transporter [Acidobacteriota bacterium]
MERRDAWVAPGLLFLATTVWACTFPLYKVLLTVWTPVQVQFWRYALGTLWMCLLGRLQFQARGPRDVGRGLLIGLVLWGGFTAQVYGIRHTTASKAAFLTALLILFGPLLYFGMAHLHIQGAIRRVPRMYGLYWGLALAGVALLTLRDWTWDWNRGDTFSVMAALAFALQMVLVDRWVDPTEGRWYAFLQIAAVALGTALWALIFGEPLIADANPPWVWMTAGALGLLPSWLAFEWQMRAQPRLQTPVASFIYAMEPLEAALLSWVLLGERLTASQWLGGCLIVSALLGTSLRWAEGDKVGR